MPRYATPENKILHSQYRRAWLFVRGDTYYTSINSTLIQTTGLQATEKNKRIAVSVLNDRVNQFLFPSRSESVTIREAVIQFVHSKKKKVALRTLEQYHTIFETYLLGDQLTDDTAEIRKRILSITAQSEHKPNTINFHLRSLHTLFEFCVELNYCTKNPITPTMIPDKVTNEPRPFTDEEITDVIQQLRSGANYVKFTREREELILLIRLLSVAGLRIAESLRLVKSDILPDGLRIDGKRVSIHKPKIRFIPFKYIPELAEICEQLKTYNKGSKVFTWVNRANPADNLRKTMLQLGMDTDNKNLHSLRKTALNRWEKELGLPEEIRNMLAGHTSAVKSNYYRASDMQDTISKIESMTNFVRNL